MKRNTKKLILEKATECFNKEGFGKVSMFEVAKELGLSRGNLAYHFKTKEQLLEAISNQMWLELKEKRKKTLSFPSFKNLSEEFYVLYKIQQAYSFIFLDTNVLKHPLIQKRFREEMRKYVEDNKIVIAFAIKMGNIHPEPISGIYNQLALNSWMICFFWLSKQIILGEESKESLNINLFSLIIPFLTEKGKVALTNFLGEETMNNLGDPFDTNIDLIIGF